MERTKKLLEAHGIKAIIKDGRILAEDVACKDGDVTRRWVDITDWSRRQLAEWLGY